MNDRIFNVSMALELTRTELAHIRNLATIIAGYLNEPDRGKYLKETGKDLEELIDWITEIDKPNAKPCYLKLKNPK